MKIAVIGAHGNAGNLIAQEAEQKGHEITAIVRQKRNDNFEHIIEKDLMNLNKEDLAGFDAVVNAVSAWTEETFDIHTTGLSHLANLLEGTDTKLLMVGGAGTLYINKEHSLQVMDQPGFPDEIKPLGKALRANLNRLRSFSNLRWTYVTPAFELDIDGAKTGKYIIGGEEYFTNEKSESYISYADFALAFVEIIENDYTRRRVSVIGE
ncbi:NADH-flavin reductase [Staphylococcus gallinarum]|uniref:NAD(P)-dependent oxidoreductase n=1 Tax=Staphylococcus gallinarum TaxID=1293 RepID=UPI000D1E7176|nr:NAD(P)H-binding protein [Staphylococcus gallinarum]MCD8785557.1 NAD(P)H-binding protein [Staphylococcus gallinarum]MCD8858261.1 NAD(P)H-binding protein [Staphylococcus gallinarum]PTL16800.1 NADH-flavin reductase [Staphylococcus gallinarum]RIO78102.1 NAD-dependent epimerase/dehydratase family protein [Staphylococcus gallinarum]